MIAVRAAVCALLLTLLPAGAALADLLLVTDTAVLCDAPRGRVTGPQLLPQTICTMLAENERWVQVRLAGGKTGWLPGAAGRIYRAAPLAPTAPSPPAPVAPMPPASLPVPVAATPLPTPATERHTCSAPAADSAFVPAGGGGTLTAVANATAETAAPPATARAVTLPAGRRTAAAAAGDDTAGRQPGRSVGTGSPPPATLSSFSGPLPVVPPAAVTAAAAAGHTGTIARPAALSVPRPDMAGMHPDSGVGTGEPASAASRRPPDLPLATRSATVAAPAMAATAPPAAPAVSFYVRTDGSIRLDRATMTIAGGMAPALVPGDARTADAVTRGEVRVNGADQPGLRAGVPGEYVVTVDGPRVRVGARLLVTVPAPSPAATGRQVPPPVVRPAAVAAAIPAAAGAAQPARSDSGVSFRGVHVTPGMRLDRALAVWGEPDTQYVRKDNHYYQFGPLTLYCAAAAPNYVDGIVFGAGWSVYGVQPGMMLTAVTAQWGPPLLPPVPLGDGVWRCGWLRGDEVLGCTLAGADGPVTDISLARRATAR